ncbi:hypothetical protein OAF24_03135 [bacterium]|nr:hypothetical protein [bacterium]
MKHIALPAMLVAVAFFGFSSTASAHPGHGGGPGHSHGNGGGYNSSFAPGGCYGGGGGYGSYSRRSTTYFVQPRSYNNFGYQSYGNGYNKHSNHNHGYNQSGLRLRSGGLSIGLRF